MGKQPTIPLHEVRNSPIHGRGVFAARRVRKGQRILRYVGEKITKEESERRAWALYDKSKKDGGAAVYIFILDEVWDIDGDVPENDAKFINHSCDPNCETWIIDDEIWVCALRGLQPGEELTFNYGFAFENWEDHPCRCGTAKCVHWIVAEEYWPRLKRELAQRAKKASATTKVAKVKKASKA